MITFRLVGPRRRLDPRTGTQRAADAIARIDRSAPVQTRSAMTLAAIDQALSGTQRAFDALRRIDPTTPATTRSAQLIAAIDQALSQRVEVVELLDWPPCYFCGAPHPDPGTPCPSCRDGAVGVRSSSYDVRPVGAKVERRPCGPILGIR